MIQFAPAILPHHEHDCVELFFDGDNHKGVAYNQFDVNGAGFMA